MHNLFFYLYTFYHIDMDLRNLSDVFLASVAILSRFGYNLISENIRRTHIVRRLDRRSSTLIYNIIITLLVLVNSLAFILYGMDKIKAVNNEWRISEKRLLRVSLIGPFGGWLGMKLFRHKIKKPRFYVGIPFFAMVQLIVIAIIVWMMY